MNLENTPKFLFVISFGERKIEIRVEHIILLFIAALALLARIIPGPRTIDDAYITFRYARNILSGDGFVFNPGEHVLGTTTPLYTLWMALLGLFLGGSNAPFPHLALITNAIADAICCILLYALGKRSGSQLVAISVSIAWAIAPFSVTFAIGGLETSVYVLFINAAIYAYLRQSYLSGAIFAALSLLTRPDALIFIGPLFLLRMWSIHFRINKKVLLEAAAFIIPITVWIFFAAIYFGSPIPSSILAKSLAYQLPSEAAFIRIIQHYATPFMENLTFSIPAIIVGVILYPSLFIIGARKIIPLNPTFAPFTLYPFLYFLTYSFANPLVFRWYLTPPLPGYIFTILYGAESLLQAVYANIFTRSKTSKWYQPVNKTLICGLILLPPLIFLLRGWDLHPDHGLNTPAPKMAWIELELLYKQAASLIENDAPDTSDMPVLAAGDVGVLGFYTETIILDTVGLNSPITHKYYPLDRSFYTINYAVPSDLIIDQEPDYVVILEVYGRRGLLKDARFIEKYKLLHKIDTDIYGSDGMLLFKLSQ